MFFYVSYSTLFVVLVPRERYLEGELDPERQPRALVRRRAEPRRGCSSRCSRRRSRSSSTRSRSSSRRFACARPPRGAADRGAGKGHLIAGHALHLAARRSSAPSWRATATINFFNFVFFALFILYATRVLGVAPGDARARARRRRGRRRGRRRSSPAARAGAIGVGPAFVAGCVLFPAPLAAVPLAGGAGWPILACLFLAEFISGFGVMLLDITAGAICGRVVPDRLRARVAGAYMVVNYGVRPLGALAGGALGTWIGLRPTLWIAPSARSPACSGCCPRRSRTCVSSRRPTSRVVAPFCAIARSARCFGSGDSTTARK